MFIGTTLFDAQTAAWLRWNGAHPLARGLAFGGRHSLHIYMLHQPVFLGLLSAWFWLSGQNALPV